MIAKQLQGSVQVLMPKGAIVAEAVAELREALQEAAVGGPPRVVVDLREVAVLDSAALEALLEGQELCRARGGDLRLAAANELCRDILAATGLDKSFDLFPTSALAAGSFAL
jgi:anti-sigma B factor antagonist